MPSKAISTKPEDNDQGNSFKTNPLRQVRELYNLFVKGLFAAAPNGLYHWADGEEETEIYITDEGPVDTAVAGTRPAISFSRGPIQFYSLGIDDMMNYDFDTARKRKGVLIPGVMTINCISSVDLESEHLAWIVAEHIWILREQLIKSGFFEIGRQLQITAPSPAGSLVSNDAGKDWYCTSVYSPFQFPRMSQFTPLNQQVLENIKILLRAGVLPVSSQGFPAAAPHEYPVQVQVCPPPAFLPNASDAHGRSPDPAGVLPPEPPRLPHPLNPAVSVRLRSVNPYKPGLRPPAMAGRAIPIAETCVKESNSKPPVLATLKV